MNFSYDYEEFIEEIKRDLSEGLITLSDSIKIVRGKLVEYNYRPIIDYYYEENKPDEEYEVMQVSKVLDEMVYYNKIIK